MVNISQDPNHINISSLHSSTPTPCLSDSTEPPRYQSQLPNRYRKRDTQDNNPDAEAAVSNLHYM